MKKYWKEIMLFGIIVIIIIPLIIAYFLSFRLIQTDITNEWIGFWGGYLGSLFGGLITLYVMHNTNKVSYEHVNLSIENEKQLERRREKVEFCNMLIEKVACATEQVEDMFYRANDCKIDEEDVVPIQEFSRKVRSARTIVLELKMHFEVAKSQKLYESVRGEEISKLVSNLYDEIDNYYEAFLNNNTYREETIFALVNEIDEEFELYIKELLK